MKNTLKLLINTSLHLPNRNHHQQTLWPEAPQLWCKPKIPCHFPNTWKELKHFLQKTLEEKLHGSSEVFIKNFFRTDEKSRTTLTSSQLEDRKENAVLPSIITRNESFSFITSQFSWGFDLIKSGSDRKMMDSANSLYFYY